MKKLMAIIMATAALLALTACAPKKEVTEKKVNVFTSRDFTQKDYVIQLNQQEYIDLLDKMTGSMEEAPIVPTETPTYILQYMPQTKDDSAVYWWVWTDPNGTLTLVNSTADPKKAYKASEVTSHDFGEMIEKSTDGQGPKCC